MHIIIARWDEGVFSCDYKEFNTELARKDIVKNGSCHFIALQKNGFSCDILWGNAGSNEQLIDAVVKKAKKLSANNTEIVVLAHNQDNKIRILCNGCATVVPLRGMTFEDDVIKEKLKEKIGKENVTAADILRYFLGLQYSAALPAICVLCQAFLKHCANKSSKQFDWHKYLNGVTQNNLCAQLKQDFSESLPEEITRLLNIMFAALPPLKDSIDKESVEVACKVLMKRLNTSGDL